MPALEACLPGGPVHTERDAGKMVRHGQMKPVTRKCKKSWLGAERRWEPLGSFKALVLGWRLCPCSSASTLWAWRGPGHSHAEDGAFQYLLPRDPYMVTDHFDLKALLFLEIGIFTQKFI